MSRNLKLDIIRAAAIILVVIQHAWTMLNMDTAENGLLCYAYRAIVNCGVPLFVMVSGALLLGQPVIPITSFLRKRFSRVLIPFLFWAVVVYTVSIFTYQYNGINGIGSALINFIPYLLENRINQAYWFVHMIIALYLLTPLLKRALQSEDGKKQLAPWLLIMAVVIVLAKQFYPEMYILNYASGLCIYIGYFIAGWYIREILDKHEYKPIFRWLFPMLGVVLYSMNVQTDCHVKLVEVLTTVCLFSCLYQLDCKRQGAYVFLSRYSYMIYLIHIPIIRALYLVAEKMLGYSFNELSIYPIIPILIGAVVIIGCTLFGWIMDKWGKLNPLIGISK